MMVKSWKNHSAIDPEKKQKSLIQRNTGNILGKYI